MPASQAPGIGLITDNVIGTPFSVRALTSGSIKLAMTTLASTLLLTPTAWSAEQSEIARPATALGIMFHPVMNNTTIDLGLRNFYFNRKFEDTRTDDDGNRFPENVESWSQGALLNLSSGYFADIIGFDASLYGALKLVGDEKNFGSGALRTKTPSVKDGKVIAKQESYDKVGQAYLKAQFGTSDTLSAHIKGGRMLMDTPLLNDSDSRTTPSSTQGLYADFNLHQLNFYGIFSDKASGKTESGYHSYKNDRGQTWNVGVAGVSLVADNGLAFHAATGRADKYMTQNFLNVSYNHDLGSRTDFMLDGYFQRAKDDGNKYDGKLDSKLWNLAAQITFNTTLSIMASFQGVIGDAYDYCWDGCRHDDSGLITWNAVQYLDFNKKDEKSWQGRVDYGFDNIGLPGLSIMTRYVSGEFKDGKTVKEWERDTDLRYRFRTGALQGLAITWRNATVRSATFGNSIDENRLIIDYTLPLI